MKYKVGDKTLMGEIIRVDEETFMYTISMKQGMFLSTRSMSEFWIDKIIIKPKRNIDAVMDMWDKGNCEDAIDFFRDHVRHMNTYEDIVALREPYVEPSRYPKLTPEELKAVKWLVDGGYTEMYGSGQEINFAVGGITFDAVRNGSTTLPIFKCFQLKKWYNSRTINLAELLAAQEGL